MNPQQMEIFYGSGSVGAKGQIVIPIKFRKIFNIHPGDQVIFMGNPQQNAFAVMRADQLSAMQTQLDQAKAQIERANAELANEMKKETKAK
ncbi:AbrB family transcriptional regulator [Dehalococcoides mccartyi]|uniref:AbrB/MazE/SpoVT family DNA-binding domain-containing protein n=1 Tax=Dehalococcoides mccartyi TaxID=61435 RepID=UPI0002B76188|nr:AbrB/MazE/SpoVT family DNA-binding domain-containing protein [Dehalococcoides mccartyi]AGG08618.1 transcriptional regulator, AbrB family [Dehalococcoides mccartyi BTF08]KSV18212.1 AbrB family transcriptional regulator [Dehalococcoides mccartyi]